MSRLAAGPGLLLALALCLSVGCKPVTKKLAEVLSVKGKVAYKNGLPLSGGSVEFRSVTDPNLSTSADIQADGTFTLSTFNEKERVKGAPPGEYRVTVVPPSGADQN